MRRKMERFVILPFSVGCISESSIAVGIQHNAPSKPPHPNSSPRSSEKDQDGDEVVGEMLLEERLKNSQKFTALAKPNIGVGIHRLYKGFKNISQLFVYKEEEMEEIEMEIGSPTDVKHVTHIGCDATTTISDDHDHANINPFINDWETLLASISSSTSWSQFEDQLSNPTHHLPNIVHHSISKKINK